MDKPIVILDANAFITAQSLLQLGADHRLITTPDVLDELRDVKTRDMLEKFPFTIEEMECDKKSLAIVKEFAKRTGDISSLSDVDMELIALTYMLYSRNGKESELRKEPPALKEYEPKEGEEGYEEYSGSSSEEQPEQKQQKDVDQEIKEVGEQEEQTQEIVNNINKDNDQQKESEDDGWVVIPKKKTRKVSSSDEEIDDDEGWVTPQNFEKKMIEGVENCKEEEKQVEEDPKNSIWIMTADFAMQNVAIQMGMLLKSLDGRKITQVRRFILECYLCWKKYKVQTNKVKLCKECGYNSLSKIAYSMTGDGRMILHRKKGWKPNQKVLEWKQRKYEEQQKKKKHQHARRKKQASIFDA